MKISRLLEAPNFPHALLVKKQLWLNFEDDDATPIGWELKRGKNPHGNRGLRPGDLLIAPYTYKDYPNYKVVIDQNGESIKSAAPEFLPKELADLIASGALKVVVRQNEVH